jgi:hypothetical protein
VQQAESELQMWIAWHVHGNVSQIGYSDLASRPIQVLVFPTADGAACNDDAVTYLAGVYASPSVIPFVPLYPPDKIVSSSFEHAVGARKYGIMPLSPISLD